MPYGELLEFLIILVDDFIGLQAWEIEEIEAEVEPPRNTEFLRAAKIGFVGEELYDNLRCFERVVVLNFQLLLFLKSRDKIRSLVEEPVHPCAPQNSPFFRGHLLDLHLFILVSRELLLLWLLELKLLSFYYQIRAPKNPYALDLLLLVLLDLSLERGDFVVELCSFGAFDFGLIFGCIRRFIFILETGQSFLGLESLCALELCVFLSFLQPLLIILLNRFNVSILILLTFLTLHTFLILIEFLLFFVFRHWRPDSRHIDLDVLRSVKRAVDDYPKAA